MAKAQLHIAATPMEPCDFIYNDFSLTHPGCPCRFLEIRTDELHRTVPFRVQEDTIFLGLWLCELPARLLSQACRFLFGQYPGISMIRYENCPTELTRAELCQGIQRNHWKILFPPTYEELCQRLSSKKRYNIRRQKRLAMELPGGYRIAEYTAETVPDQVIETYFSLKQEQFGTDYRTTPRGYLSEYHVSHVYALELCGTIGAVVMTCEQHPYVYLENLAYDPKFSSYSLGATLYDHVLELLIRKGKAGLYLGYGQHQYKSLYGAVEQTVYCATVYRSRSRFLREVRLPQCRRAIRSRLGKIKRSLLRRRKE